MVRTTRKHRGRRSLRNPGSLRRILQHGGAGGIPKIIHQIWFGSPVPELRKPLFAFNEEVAKRNGYAYKLWVEEDRIAKRVKDMGNGKTKNVSVHFEVTTDYQDTAIKAGEETEQNRMAQVADLARIEILYNHGGIYIDSLIEISDEFIEAIEIASEKGATFIGANEDPCDLDCEGGNGKKYLTNSFFATNKYNGVLERLLDFGRLDAIDFENQYINQTTGPYYLRSGIEDPKADKVFLFKSDQIFPFREQETRYQPAVRDVCLFTEDGEGRMKIKEAKGTAPALYLKQKCLEGRQAEFIARRVTELKHEQEAANETASKRLQKIIDSANTNPTEFIVSQRGPLAIYHSGLGGTWSW